MTAFASREDGRIGPPEEMMVTFCPERISVRGINSKRRPWTQCNPVTTFPGVRSNGQPVPKSESAVSSFSKLAFRASLGLAGMQEARIDNRGA
jgi:hypothetical protein